jgi:hypothetical protein
MADSKEPQSDVPRPAPSVLPDVDSPPPEQVLEDVPSTDEIIQDAQSADEILQQQPDVDELTHRRQ